LHLFSFKCFHIFGEGGTSYKLIIVHLTDYYLCIMHTNVDFHYLKVVSYNIKVCHNCVHLISNIEMYCTNFVDMFMISVHAEFYVPRLCVSLSCAIRLQGKYKLCLDAITVYI